MTKKKPSKRNTRRASGAKRATREENQNSPQDQDGFPIVGVGASAGGLQALQTLLQAMPDEPGVAIVVIQHLDPTKKSLGPELLAKCTKMQVAEVADDPRVKPNRVYVLPPDKYLSISGGELHLSEPDQPRGTRRAIDFFLRSLASDQQQCAVGVILSGSGTDGTLGIKAIKAAGGLVIAQDPTTAEHEGMPRSAIDSGAVDHVLPPDEIPSILVRYAEHSYVREGPATPAEEREAADQPAAEESTGDIQPIIAFLRAGTKHDFRNYKDKTLVRRTRRRMCLHHIDDYEAYLKYLREHPGEADALVKDLLITVTDFFREPEAWEELRKLAIQPMIEAKEDDEPIRVWTPGCATGEEPYSLAMLILEELKQAGKNCPLTVFASDIDKDAIAFAREGRYPRSIEADVSRERLRQFFAPVDGADYYHVNKSLREVVTFADQNLIADPPFSRLDLLCCRNLLIYLKGEVQEKIVALFHFALREGGVLFLGSAETIGRQTDLFQTLHKRWRIFRRVGPTQHNRVDIPISDVQQRREIDVQPAPPLRRETRLSHLAQQRLLDMLAPSAVLVDAKWRILYICGDVDPYLSLKAGVPTVDLLDNARPGLRSKLRVVVQRALSEDRPTTVQARVQRAGRYHPVGITVHVVHDREADEALALVMFEEFETDRSRTRQSSEETAQDLEANRRSAHADPNSGESGYKKTEVDDLDDHVVIRQLEEELAATKADLQATVEQLESSNEEYKASNEEVMSINEELQSTNEELETSKEELQSLNEELSTVNNQLGAKVEELETKTSDLQNLLTATDVATICLDTDLAIRWFTPAVQELIRLREADKGRPLADFTDDFSNGELVKVARRVLDKLTPVEDEARCNDGRTFLRRTTPYRTEDHRIGGVVITFFDITERKKAEVAMATAKGMAEKIVDTVRESMLVLDTELRVITANQSFYEKFQVSPAETEGRLVYKLGNNQWDIPELRRLLEEILPENSVFNDYEVDHVFETIGRKVMRLNARRVDHIQRILLAIEDITEHRLAEGRRTFLLELMDAFWDCENPAELPEQATSRLRRFLRCQRAVYAELEVDENRANIIAQHAASDDELNTTHQLGDFGPEVLASLLEHGELVIDDVRSDPRCSEEAYRGAWERLGVRSLMCVARKTTADRIALVAVSFATPHQWHAEEIVLVRDVADRTWSAQNVARSDLALRESEERLRRAAEATGFGTYDYDVAGKRSIWSPEMYTILGVMEFTQPNPQIIDQLVHPDDRKMFRRGKQAILDPAGPGCHEMEFRIVRPDGETRWIRDAGQTFFASSGDARRAVRVVGTVQDISQEKHTEESLRESERLFRAMADNVPLIIWMQDANGQQEFVNQTFCEYFGLNRETMRGDRWQELIDPKDTVYVRKFIDCVSARRPFHGQVRVRRADGQWRWIESWARPRFGLKGEFLGHVGGSVDITERKRAELELKRLNETLEQQVADQTATLTMLRDVATISNKAVDFESAMRESLRRVSEHNGWSCGHVWLPVKEDANVLVPGCCWYQTARPTVEKLCRQILSLRLRPGEGMAGRVFATGTPEYTHDIDGRLAEEKAELAKSAKVRTACAFPLTAHEKVLGVLEFFAEADVELTAEVRDSLANVGALLGHLLHRQTTLDALHYEHELSEGIINATQSIVILLDAAGRILRINPYLEELTGYSLAEVRGRDWFETFLPDQQRRQIRRVFDDAIAGKATRGNVNPIVSREGEVRTVEWHDAPLTTAGGELIGLVAVGHDITDLQQALETAEHSEARLQAILRAAPDPIVSIDRTGIIVDLNPATEALFGYTRDEMVGQNVSLLMPPPYREEHDGYLDRYLQSRKPHIIGVGREVRAQHKDGRIFPIELSVNEIDHTETFVGIVRDVTARKELEREVVDAATTEQRRIGQDIHDGVGQEMTGLRYMAQTHAETLAAQSSTEAKTAQRMVEWLETVQRQLRHIIRELIPVEIDNHGLVAALRGLAERTSHVHDVTCEFEGDPTIFISDLRLATHVYRIAQEAVQNAVKHAQASQIRIQLTEENEALRLQVEDDGVGVDATPAKTNGFGLRLMAYRASLIGANFTCRPRAQGGTQVTCEVLRGGANGEKWRMPEDDDLKDGT